MAYAEQEWRNDDTATPLSAARLLHIEGGLKAAHDGLSTKADASAVPDVSEFATKTEMNAALSGKANTGDIPDTSGLVTTSAMNTALGAKADTSAMNTALGTKADKSAIPDVSGLATQASVSDLVARIEALEAAAEPAGEV